MIRAFLAAALVLAAPAAAEQSAPAPKLAYAFSIRVEVAPPVEQGEIDGGRRRFIPITGGMVYGPRLKGTVLPGGGDWQTIMPGGLARIEARYFVKAEDGTVVEIVNPGVRVATAEVTEKLAKGEPVDPSQYYFRTTPRFGVTSGKLDWLNRAVFVARGIRRPDHVVIDYYVVE